MQSGISASAELQSAFKDLLANPSQRGLLITIENEALKPLTTLDSSSSSFHDDLSNLAPHLKPNQALYILLRKDSSFVAVTYVPNAAPVRQKMLFASTQRTLIKDLGPEHFGETFFTTEASELTAEGWKKHEAHTDAEQPLTQEEQEREGIRAAEAQEQGGTSRRGAGYGSGGSSGVSTNVGEGVEDALRKLGEGAEGGELVQLKIDVPTETIVIESVTSGVSPDALASNISSTDPRYSFYSHSYTDPATSESKSAIIFLYTCPTAAKIKERMIYASSRQSTSILAERGAGLSIAKKLEASDPSDITAETIEAEFAPKVEAKSTFSKPKRPGRR
ncbi:actin depolymerizing protein [Rhizodiscina lignyota]|uniref:Twinfilin n=1 Tax=Rhizodiscina lignyota TaxID=1504668 RepID=A0A9P4M800_9PEZI|nr:actin depolymerizing protein [Rhizodiscina lignyota]